MSLASTPGFQIGGTIRQENLYIHRPADVVLRDELSRGQFCAVLAPRQVGKSSLRDRTALALQQQHGIRCVSIDLQAWKAVDDGALYESLIREVAKGLHLPAPIAEPYSGASPLPPAVRWYQFMQQELLAKPAARLVLILDEVDTLLQPPGRIALDSFFQSLRALWQESNTNPAGWRVTFCLFGFTTLDELVSDPVRSPLNQCVAIDLGDFTREEAQGFLPGLRSLGELSQRYLDAIYKWTDGHPYYTNLLCHRLLNGSRTPDAEPGTEVEAQVHDSILNVVQKDIILRSTEERFLQLVDAPSTRDVVLIYRQLLLGEVVEFQPANGLHRKLLISGMVKHRFDHDRRILVIRNRIVRECFDYRWLLEVEPSYARWIYQRLLEYRQSPPTQRLERSLSLVEIQDALRTTTRANQVLAPDVIRFVAESQGLRLAQQTKNRLRTTLILTLVIVIVMGGMFSWAYRSAQSHSQAATQNVQLLRQQLAAARFEVARLQKRVEDLQRDLDELQKSRLTLEGEISRLVSLRGDLAKKTYRVRKKNESLLREIDTLQNSISRLTTESAKLLARMGVKQADLQDTSALKVRREQESSAVSLQLRQVQPLVSEPPQQRIPQPLPEYLKQLQREIIASTKTMPGQATDADAADRRQAMRRLRQVLAATELDADRPSLPTVDVPKGQQTFLLSCRGVPRQGEPSFMTFGVDGNAWLWTDRGVPINLFVGTVDRLLDGAALGEYCNQMVALNAKRVLLHWTNRLQHPQNHALPKQPYRFVAFARSSDDEQPMEAASAETAEAKKPERGLPLILAEGRRAHVFLLGKSGLREQVRLNEGVSRAVQVEHRAAITALSLAPGAQKFATAADDTAYLWQTFSGTLSRELPGHTGKITAVDFLGNDTLITASEDGTARIWESARYQARVLRGHVGEVRAVTASPDQRYLVTAGVDGTVRIWDPTLGLQLFAIQRLQQPALMATFSGDGNSLAVLLEDGSVRIYSASDLQFIRMGCKILATHPEYGPPPAVCSTLAGRN